MSIKSKIAKWLVKDAFEEEYLKLCKRFDMLSDKYDEITKLARDTNRLLNKDLENMNEAIKLMTDLNDINRTQSKIIDDLKSKLNIY